MTDVFFKLNCDTEECQSLNRYHIKWECLMMSEIVIVFVGGCQLEKHILDPPNALPDHSNYTFPLEKPTKSD